MNEFEKKIGIQLGDKVRVTGGVSYGHCHEIGQIGKVVGVREGSNHAGEVGDRGCDRGHVYAGITVEVSVDDFVQCLDSTEVEKI